MTLPAQISKLATSIANTKKRIDTEMPSGMPILKLLKQGFWVFGAEQIEVEEDSLWAINPMSFAEGYISWAAKGGTKLGEEMASIEQEPILKSALPETGAPWSKQVSMQLVCVSGEDKGQSVVYSTNAFGGVKEYSRILGEVLGQLEEDATKPVMICILDVDSYTHKDYGKVFTPTFALKEWKAMEDTADDVEEPEDEEEEPEEPAPRKRRRRVSKK